MFGPEHETLAACGRRVGRTVTSRIAAFFAFALLCLMPSLASAQTVTQYSNTTSGTIVESTNCATTLTRTFTVGTSYIVGDVDLGVFLAHSYRSDLRLSLTSPTGTTVNLMVNTGGSGDNLNDMFNDEATASIETHNGTATDSVTVPPPYAHSFKPTGILSAFDGQNAQGTWSLIICDSVASDTGGFTRADLYITSRPVSYADLSLTKTVSNAAPNSGATISYILSANNAAASPNSASGVTVRDILPAGVTFVSASGTGTYNSGTGIWTVGALAPGASASITITVTVSGTSGAVVTNGAEVSASSVVDIDSTPGNNSTTEDDDAFVSFTFAGARAAGTPPTFTCPAGTNLFDWNGRVWTVGTLNNNYAQAGIGTINFALSSTTAFVTGSPILNANLTGGMAATELSLFENLNNAAQSDAATTVITLPTAVPGLRFRLLDIDFGSASFADKVTVTGKFQGSTVIPVLTNGVSNYVVGNVAIGDVGAADTSANGNVIVTFSAPVDTVTITYGNHTTAPANPGNQWMSIHDITLCNPVADLSVTKVSSIVSDGVSSSNPKSIPGAIVRYCILVSNLGSSTAANVSIGDAIPSSVTFVPGTILSGNSCTGATTAEDDNAAGGDESDPFGVSVTGTNLTATAAMFGPARSLAITFNATVN